MNALLLQSSRKISDIMQIPHTGKPAIQPTSPSIRERGQVSYGGTVAERSSVPVVKAASIHHEQTPPVGTERQIDPPASPDKPDERQKTTTTPAAPPPTRPVQNDTAPVIPERKRLPLGKRIQLYHPAYHRQKGVDKNSNSGVQTEERGEAMKLRHLFFACSGVFVMMFSCSFLVVIVFSDEEDGGSGGNLIYGGVSVSQEVLAPMPHAGKVCKGIWHRGILKCAAAIIQVESGGTLEDVMQSSNLWGFPELP